MKSQTLGMMISNLRKQRGMTQLDLAEKMNVTDKAVSKWERDISCPDINSIPKLAEIFNISVDELMQYKNNETADVKSKIEKVTSLIFKVIPIAMGVAVTVLSILNEIDTKNAFILIGIGMASAGICLLNTGKDDK
jgi:transcriptional regulator with XRE-family HTH domain